jgi:hypothetical protein
MIVMVEPQPTRTGPVSYPCVACGSAVTFEQVYCADCLRAIRNGCPRSDNFANRILAELDRTSQFDPDMDVTRDWLRRKIEHAT